jgi:hypothetical protein
MTYISATLREEVIRRANSCCEYCLLSQENHFLPFEIDHIIAEKHDGTTTLDNLCLSCFDCNRFKGSDIASLDPQTRRVSSLFNPREQIWIDHFQLKEGLIEGITPEGRVTVFLLRLNLPDRVEERVLLHQINSYLCK